MASFFWPRNYINLLYWLWYKLRGQKRATARITSNSTLLPHSVTARAVSSTIWKKKQVKEKNKTFELVSMQCNSSIRCYLSPQFQLIQSCVHLLPLRCHHSAGSVQQLQVHSKTHTMKRIILNNLSLFFISPTLGQFTLLQHQSGQKKNRSSICSGGKPE